VLEMRDFRFALYSIAVLGLNLASIVLGLVYLVFPGQSVFWIFAVGSFSQAGLAP